MEKVYIFSVVDFVLQSLNRLSLTKQLSAKSTPCTRSSLGVSRMARHRELLTSHTWTRGNVFFRVLSLHLKGLYHADQQQVVVHLEGANPALLVMVMVLEEGRTRKRQI